MTSDYFTLWHAANNGSGKLKWFVSRGGRPDAYYVDSRRTIRRYATLEAAEKVARTLNNTAPQAEHVWNIN